MITVVSLAIEAEQLCMCKTIYNLDGKYFYFVFYNLVYFSILYFKTANLLSRNRTWFQLSSVCDWQLDARQ